MPDDDNSGSYERNKKPLYEPTPEEEADVDADCKDFLAKLGKPSRETIPISSENALNLLRDVKDELEKGEEK